MTIEEAVIKSFIIDNNFVQCPLEKLNINNTEDGFCEEKCPINSICLTMLKYSKDKRRNINA